MPAGAPKNTLQLQGAVQTINVNNVLGLRYYYRSCETLLKQCNVFRSEGDKQNLFVGLMRFSSLLVETIPRHNQFNKKTDAHYKLLYKALLESLEELEGLKKDINAAAAAYEARSKLEASARAAQARANAQFADESVGLLSQQALKLPGVTAADLDDLYLGKLGLGGGKVAPEYLAPPLPAPVVPQYRPSPEFDFKASEGALQRHSLLPPPPPPPAGRQGETGKPARPPAPPPGPLYPDFDATPAHAPPPDAFQKRQLQAPAPAPAPEEARPSAPPQPQVAMPAPEQVAMPVQPQVAMPAPGAQVAMPASRQVAVPVPGPQYAPNLGPQLMEVNTLADTPETVGPLPPGHHTCSHASPGAVVPAGHQHSHGAPPRPAEVADPRPGRAEKQEGLMAVHISSHLLEEFMRLAGANTRNNLETCAVLAGQLKQGVYFINTLIVPKQEATCAHPTPEHPAV
mmetsp:Transcript_58516/g.186461  ORF Transcript_58516/g.186461 Transcript_58516/m.186461 type:complete len:457 (+) Transcript_58516:184-1554(+)